MFERFRDFIRALLVFLLAVIPVCALADGPGGILENISNAQYRTPPTASQIAAFLPSRGKFTFPAPWNTTGYRITNASDCGGSDCLVYVGYSYWRNMNNSAGSNTMYIMLDLYRSRGGGGPTLFQLDKTTGAVTNLGPLFDSSNILSWTTALNGYYFSYSQPTKLWVTYHTQMMLYDVITHTSSQVFDIMQYLNNVDIATAPTAIANLADNVRAGATYYLFQSHTSNDDLAHSATVENPNGGYLGCIVWRDDTGAVSYFPASGSMDECQIGRGGRWLQIKENNNNLFIDLANNNSQTLLLDQDGAPGHSDMGVGYMVGADNYAPQANTERVWNLATMTNVIAYHNSNWNVDSPHHISWTNARGDIPVGEQHACGGSNPTATTPEVGEIFCFNLNGSGDVMVAAPTMSDPSASGGSWNGSYGMQNKGNQDPTGQYFIWTSNMGSSRLDAFVVSLPTHLLNDPTIANGSGGSIEPQPGSGSTGGSSGGTTTDTTPPVISSINATASSTSAAVSWTTNEASDTQVDYGTTTNYGSSTTLDSNLTTSHSQSISGLTSATTYHYRVKSRDAAGNLATSGDLTFTTATPADTTAPVVSSISASPTTSGATISWTTNEASDTQVDYGLTSNYGSSTALDSNLTTSHSQAISGLASATTYHYRVKSRDAAGNLTTSGDLTFTTAQLPDTTPPVISMGGTVVGTDNATINWTTDEAADSQVQYGTTTGYGSSTALDSTLTTTHSQYLSGLQASTTYHFRVLSRDAAGNLAVSSDQTFATAAATSTSLSSTGSSTGSTSGGTTTDTTPPVIGQVAAAPSTNDASVTWTTDEAADSQVDYGLTSSYGSSTPLDTSLVTSHSQVLSGLQAGTTYHYRVRSADASGNQATSADQTFTTAADTTTVSTSTGSGTSGVAWQDPVNVTISGSSLRKTSGCDGCADASAASTAQISASGGYFEFTANETTQLRMAGLASSDVGSSYTLISFAIRLQKGWAEVREDGVYKADTQFTSGDIFRINVNNGVVTYSRNGSVFYTSKSTASGQLMANAVLFDSDSTIGNAILSQSSGTTSTTTTTASGGGHHWWSHYTQRQ